MKTIKKWQEPFYAIGGFGPGFMYQLVLTYLLYYYRPAQAKIEAGALVFAPAAGVCCRHAGGAHPGWRGGYPHRQLDGQPEEQMGAPAPPDGAWVDPGNHLFRPAVVPTDHGNGNLGADGHWGNAVYVAVVSTLYFFFHTLLTVPYLAALSEIVPDENSRVRVASWQTVFNTGSYVLVFVVAPLLFAKFGVRGAALMLLPELSDLHRTAAGHQGSSDRWVCRSESGKASIALGELEADPTNKTFLIYMSSVATFFFGLQFFLGGMAFMAAGHDGDLRNPAWVNERSGICPGARSC